MIERKNRVRTRHVGRAGTRVIWVLAYVVLGGLSCSDTPIQGIKSPASEPSEWAPVSRSAAPAPLAQRLPCAENSPLRRALFGDLHTHTALSLDALGRGGFQSPDDAYRFAKGEQIDLSSVQGQTRTARLDRPLDFAAVTDHAEWMGETVVCTDTASPAYDESVCDGIRSGDFEAFRQAERVGGRPASICGPGAGDCRGGLASGWQETVAAAERHYDRSSACAFTTFIGWEYTRAPQQSMTHRNIILRNEIGPELPISSIDAPTPEAMWKKLKARCNDNGSGCEAISIPHNSNISNGQMFAVDWQKMDLEAQRSYARLQHDMEPLIEMMQAKGASECRRGLWKVQGGDDAFCDFEQARFIENRPPPDCNAGSGAGALRGEGCQSRLDFARYALIEGLAQEERLGINPYQFGFIASTDGHNGAPGDTDEYGFQGHNSNDDSDLVRRLTNDSYVPHRLRNPGGLVGVWAEENSRDAVFDALKRREVFGTSGTRIQVRFFGGWALPDLCASSEMVADAYRAGIPMGQTLPARRSHAPMFFVNALADPGSSVRSGTPLQRIQIVKGWHGKDGIFHERVFEAAGQADNGADVSRNTCAIEGPGATSLCSVWQDPEFDSAQSAVYYARVIENPSCRWNAWQCSALPAGDRPKECAAPNIPWKIQERAWTSPIWYRPEAPDLPGSKGRS